MPRDWRPYGPYSGKEEEEWIALAHVCRQWRSVVFQSPSRLNLRLVCTPYTPVKDTLDIWPPFPLIIYVNPRDDEPCLDNIVAALEHNDRVRKIQLENFTTSKMGYITDSAAMQEPFPELTDLWLAAIEEADGICDEEDVSSAEGQAASSTEGGAHTRHLSLNVTVRADDLPRPIPNSFLGGTAPRLQSITLGGVSFPGLPKQLLSATHLVHLYLYDIPISGYIPPEAMATSLSALTSLESLRLRFRYPRPRTALDTRRLPPPPLTHSILPSLTRIDFHGASEYLEVILARIDAPRLDHLDISFFNQIIFDTPQLFQFINRRPTLRAPVKGYIEFYPDFVEFRSQTYNLRVKIQCTVSEWQLSSIEQVCTSSLPPVSTLEDLYISGYRYWQDDDENTLWLELLHPFAAVKNLYVLGGLVHGIAPALQELVGGRSTEVLPTLENIFLGMSGPLHEGIEKFVAARLLTSHPVAVFHR